MTRPDWVLLWTFLLIGVSTLAFIVVFGILVAQ